MKVIKDLNMKSSETLKWLSKEKLTEELAWSQKMLYTMKMKNAVGEQKQTHLIKGMRRYIASLKTLQGQAQN